MRETKEKVPVGNRTFFALVTLFFVLFGFKMIYEVFSPANRANAGSPPLIGWLALNGVLIFGSVLITMYGDIRLRLHRIWTPVGIFLVFWGWFIMLGHTLPLGNGVLDSVLNHSYEAYLFSTGFGLLLAFVDFSPLAKYSFYFAPWSAISVAYLVMMVVTVFSMILGFAQAPPLLNPSDPNFFPKWDEMNDSLVFISAPFFIYYMVTYLKGSWPGWKKVIMVAGVFALVSVGGLIVFHSLGGLFQKDDKIGQFLTGDYPPTSYNSSSTWQTCPDTLTYESNNNYAIIESNGNQQRIPDSDANKIVSICNSTRVIDQRIGK